MLEVAVVGSLLTTLIVTGPVCRLLRRRHVVDIPNARSSHDRVTPRGGGIAVLVGLVVGGLVGSAPLNLWYFVAMAVLAGIVGFADDLRDLSALVRLACQLLLGIGVTLVVLDSADRLPLGPLAFALASTVWVVGYVNTFNFMDGINGISGASSALAGGWFLVLSSANGDAVLEAGGAVLLGASLGFLPWNFPRARVFLGDVGSYGIGLLVGSLAVWAVAMGVEPLHAAAPLLVYVADTGYTLIRRAARGESVMAAHREHVYQRLCDVGLGHPAVTTIVATSSVVTCAIVLWLPVGAASLVVGVELGLYVALPGLLEKAERLTERSGSQAG